MLPAVTVVVPHYHDLEGLERCLSALAKQTYSSDRFEIVVADNNSPEGARAVTELVGGRARLVVVTEPGAGPARNGGVAAARSPLLAFTDSDCVPEPEWLERGLAALDGCDFAGGRMKVLVDNEARMTPAEAFERVFAFDNEDYVRRKAFTVTANLFCPASIFAAVGGFRTGVSEDLEWCLRARDRGFRIGYAPDAVVGHPARRTWGELKRKWSRLNLEAYGLAREQRLGRARWFVKALAMPASAIAHTPKVLTTRAVTGARSRLKVLGMLYCARAWRGIDYLRLLSKRRQDR